LVDGRIPYKSIDRPVTSQGPREIRSRETIIKESAANIQKRKEEIANIQKGS